MEKLVSLCEQTLEVVSELLDAEYVIIHLVT